MPSVTLTTVAPTSPSPVTLPLKASLSTPSSSSSTSTSATLRTLYTRAARAFLHRDVTLTHMLLLSAFALLPPPTSARDALSEQRRKWDILRITTEVTVYTSPPEDASSVPAPLRSNSMLSGASLLQSLHARSLQLFAPNGVADAAYLPAEVTVTLALASIKVDAPLVGRALVEDWLARRGQWQDPRGLEGYEKVLDVYCLSVLPRLDEWEYAREFLQYESELPAHSRERLVNTLASLHTDRLAARAAASLPTTSEAPASMPSPSPSPSTSTEATPTPSRPSSPTPSVSSSSTTSTQTAVPATPKPRKFATSNSLTPLSPTPVASTSSVSSAATSRTVTPFPGTRRPPQKLRSASHSPAPTTLAAASAPSVSAASTAPVSALAVLRAAIRPYVERAPRVTVFFVLCVLVPLISFVLRARRRGRVGGGTGAGAGVAGAVRRRLGGVKQGGLLKGVWDETIRAVKDTVSMGGRGLI